MQSYQLVISDLDRTLLSNDMNVSAENRDAVGEITRRGIWFVPSTGRTLAEIPAAVRALPGVRYLIYSDGSVIYDQETDQFFCEGLTPAQLEEIWAILDDYQVSPSVRNHGIPYIEESHFTAFDHYRINDYFGGLIQETARGVRGLKEFSRTLEYAEMLCIFFHSPTELLACKERLEQLSGVHVASSDPANLEVYSDKAGKGNALHRICRMLSVTPEETVAVGDSPNDVSMLKEAGLALAVSNACDPLKKVAHRVICSNEEHIAKYLLEEILDEGK